MHRRRRVKHLHAADADQRGGLHGGLALLHGADAQGKAGSGGEGEGDGEEGAGEERDDRSDQENGRGEAEKRTGESQRRRQAQEGQAARFQIRASSDQSKSAESKDERNDSTGRGALLLQVVKVKGTQKLLF